MRIDRALAYTAVSKTIAYLKLDPPKMVDAEKWFRELARVLGLTHMLK